MLPDHHRFPSRGVIAKRPVTRHQAQAMLPGPAPGPNVGAFVQQGEPPQDVVGSMVREMRVSMLDVGTALRLAGRGLLTYFGTTAPEPQVFTAPAGTNRPDSIRAGVAQAGNASQALNKQANQAANGPGGPTASKAKTLPRPVM